MADCSDEKCCEVPVCLNFICADATDEFKEQMKEIFCEILKDICDCNEFGCPDQTGEMVTLCLNGETIEVPQASVKTLLCEGAICGSCDERCCADTPIVDGKIDMCLNDNTINVSINACQGILTAGGTCGPCDK